MPTRNRCGSWSGWNTTWSTASAVTTQTYHSDSEGGYYSTSYGPPPIPANTLTEEYQLGDCASQDYESGICYSYYIQRRTRHAYSQQEVISAATPDTIRRSYRYPVTPGRYEVKVVRLDHKDTRARAGHELRWGGASNKSIKAIIEKSKEDWRALRSCEFSMPSALRAIAWKNLSKLSQFA